MSQFIKLLNSIIRYKKELTDLYLNEQVDKYFPEKEYLQDAPKTKVYFRKLVPHEIVKLNLEQLRKVLPLIDVIYKRVYESNKTLDSYFSKDIRVPIAKTFGKKSEAHKLSLKLTKLSYEDKGQLIKEAKETLNEKHQSAIEFQSEDIKKIIAENINSDDDFRKAVALALACGSRPVELFNEDCSFTIIDDVWVQQNFLAKKRGATVSVKKPIIFMSSQKFVEELNIMRWGVKDEYRKVIDRSGQLSNTIEAKANKMTKIIFNYQDGITLYSCRKIYAQLSFQEYAKNSIYGDKPTLTLWISRVLGHSEDDLETQKHYNHYRVEQPTFTSTETASKIENLEQKVDTIEQKVEDLPKIEKPPRIDAKGRKLLDKFAIVAAKYESEEKKPNQTKLEELLKKQVPREAVRIWYKKFVVGGS